MTSGIFISKNFVKVCFALFLQHLNGSAVSLANDVDTLLQLVYALAVNVVDCLNGVVGALGVDVLYA